MGTKSWSCKRQAADWGTAPAAAGPCRSCWTEMPWKPAHEERYSTSLPNTDSTLRLGDAKHSDPQDLEHKRLPSWGERFRKGFIFHWNISTIVTEIKLTAVLVIFTISFLDWRLVQAHSHWCQTLRKKAGDKRTAWLTLIE